MIDRTVRDRLAELLRQFVAGRLSNFDYDEQADKLADSPDKAIWAVYAEAWHLYCDIRKHYMSGDHALSRDARRVIARWILFLYSDREYEWPMPDWRFELMNLLTCGLWKRNHPSEPPGGDDLVWPYFRRSDFDEDLKRPRLLSWAA